MSLTRQLQMLVVATFGLGTIGGTHGADMRLDGMPPGFDGADRIVLADLGGSQQFVVWIAKGVPHSRCEVDDWGQVLPGACLKFELAGHKFAVYAGAFNDDGHDFMQVNSIDGELEDSFASLYSTRLMIAADGSLYADDDLGMATKTTAFVGQIKLRVGQPPPGSAEAPWASRVAAPFFLIDEPHCRIRDELRLTSERCGGGSLVEQLPAGSEIRLLLLSTAKCPTAADFKSNDADSADMLVATSFGLIGWATVPINRYWIRPGDAEKPSDLSCLSSRLRP